MQTYNAVQDTAHRENGFGIFEKRFIEILYIESVCVSSKKNIYQFYF